MKNLFFILLFYYSSITFAGPRVVINNCTLYANSICSGQFSANAIQETTELDVEIQIDCPLCGCEQSFPKTVNLQVKDPSNYVILSKNYIYNNCSTTISVIEGIDLTGTGNYTVIVSYTPGTSCPNCNVIYYVNVIENP